MNDVEIELEDHKGRVFDHEFFVNEDAAKGPGWYVFGRCLDDYKPRGVIKLVARPDVKARVHPHYNIRVRRGWLKKKEAQAVADAMMREMRRAA